MTDVGWLPPGSPRVRQPLTELGVQGFKSIHRRSSIRIGGLTILAGANSSGKSSHIQPLLLMKQTLEAQFDPGALLLEGPNLSVTSADQVLARPSSTSAVSNFSLTAGFSDDTAVTLSYEREQRSGFRIREMVVNRGGTTAQYREGMRLVADSLPPDARLLGEALRRASKSPENLALSWTAVRNRCFLVPVAVVDGAFAPTALPNDVPEHLSAQIQSLIHLPGLRGNPERTYRTTAIRATFPGTFEPYVASLIMAWQRQRDDRIGLVAQDLRMLGLTGTIEAKAVDDTRVELRVGRTPTAGPGAENDLVSIADVGFGVSQTLPVIVALHAAVPGQLVYIEQPEIHLHPRAQTRLAGLLVNAVNQGVVVVVETHSSLLLRGIQTAIARAELDPTDVALHWFSRHRDGTTEVTTADLAEDGSFGDWPTDFDDIALESDRDYLDAAERRLAGE
ncbi:AAA family ATPase [Frankia sp. AgB1.9]|uniref:AAA family ATPase n=1 Tax=unclassified Frankia TaxID=2632575 RepID=UPI0019317FA6|nr:MULTISPECIES: AAA family ATPase [unclassified Frankia]MBL7492828.1 AAA family ATPase [Frankia sp. AgW1.1]MBL7549003.1 AAA family ATPase [Frankia sp. AgB1.9]MBL7622547.1 AAA family ATPase [Frankia sp. AgB1.8]